ncbi:FG-GAP-like repeat-containing protein [Paenibacillus eucommiae]|uniref:6-phosphogluconolactonase (Cycloisomerase 2 family) n=1 Tax=Paenibacillus eucommiae TaxID=1355755 RepID=A0ABS4IQS4_9BACL|nr:FG-GAP-like repeat-containing protein [Paenibacillus eucommiae]MBP1989917.1 6-phosphogluconolactonase (cycloisomerase 2 family) [Paenibacillus eucommiae]
MYKKNGKSMPLKLLIGSISLMLLLVPMQAYGMPLFESAANYEVGSKPHSAVVGDFNKDGKPDMIVANYDSNTISVLLNDGNGDFLPETTIAVGTNPESAAIGDYNKDGNLDLAVVNNGSSDISILLGNGNGAFQAAVNYPSGTNPTYAAAGDLNGDGVLDLAVANYNSNNVSILLGNADGTGTFQAAVYYDFGVGSNPISVNLNDFNKDGELDLVVTNESSNNVSILLGSGDSSGSFGTPVQYNVGARPQSTVIGDFNGDGNADLVVVNNGSDDISLMLGTGDVSGTFLPPVQYDVGSYPSSAAVGDYNNDGKLDLVVANSGSFNVSVLLGDGAGRLQTSASYAVDGFLYAVAAADFDADGKLDVAVANYLPDDLSNKLTILRGNGDGKLKTAANYDVGMDPYSVIVNDFNGDGNLDAAVANNGSNNVSILLNDGAGAFQSAVHYGTGTKPYSVAVGDFNADGKADLAVANSASQDVSILLGNGDGTFQAAVQYGAAVRPVSVAVGDFNKDGKLDLTVANATSNNVSVLLGNGDGTFKAAVNFDTGSTPTAVAVGDLNADGNPDLTVTNTNSNNISVLLGKGDGTFQSAVHYGVGSSPRSLAVSDLNKDGKLDVVAANYNSGDVSILLGSGDGTLAPAVTYSLELNSDPYSVAIGDFNGDEKPDIAVANSFSNHVAILQGNGDGTVQAAVHYDTGNFPRSIAVGDFNKDGKSDVVAANTFSDHITLFNSIPPKWKLNLQSTAVSVNENSGSGEVTLVVTRDGSSTGVTSVVYTTSDGSAIAGVDYTAVTGTLVFQNNETSKSLTVPIINNYSYNGNRTFKVNLSDASPISEAMLGSLRSADVTILDDEAPPYTAPPKKLSNNAALSSLSIQADSKAVLTPAFKPEVMQYTAVTDLEDVSIQLAADDAASIVTIGGETVKGSKSFRLKEGSNVISISVKAEDGTVKNYSITIVRNAKEVKPPEETTGVKPTDPNVGNPLESGCPFKDISGHWGKAIICEAAEAGIVNGVSEHAFNPDGLVTRAQFALMLFRTLSLPGNAENASISFKDGNTIPAWSKAAIQYAVDQGIVNGYPDGTFRPNATISRTEMSAMLARAMKWKADSKEATSFADDKEIPVWGKPFVLEAFNHNILTGREGNRFEPNAQITRAESAVALTRLWKILHP